MAPVESLREVWKRIDLLQGMEFEFVKFTESGVVHERLKVVVEY